MNIKMMNERWIIFDLIGTLAEPHWADIAPSSLDWTGLKLAKIDENLFWNKEYCLLYRRMLMFRSDRLKLLRNLKDQGYKIALATNFTRAWLDHLKSKCNVYDLFDAELLSSEIRTAKPEDKFWEKLLEYVPKGSIFVDDKEKNCLAAQKFGFQTIWAHPACPVDLELKEILSKNDEMSDRNAEY